VVSSSTTQHSAIEVSLQPTLCLGGSELDHQVSGGDEAGLDAGHDGPTAQCHGQMALADAGGAEQHDVLGSLDEAQRGEFLDLWLPEKRAAICEFALCYPKIGYRKLTWMMVDAQTACVGESMVYRVSSETDLLSRWKRSTHSSGEYNFRPTVPNQQWHTDVMYGTPRRCRSPPHGGNNA
jgi:hypothetical protein